MEKAELHVTGMSCGHCVSSIESGLGEKNGIEHVEVNLQKGLVTVTFTQEKWTVDQLKGVIEDLGYEVN
ncbi:heavy-metal-associated domain-containing protein [Shouchella sp. JSM 1781072]|jgi:copper chaperone|uniref:heavy-metal-associated domain-containing protein n=1 Tax=Bacillaceae TaxID=186817 RepID=UPI000C086A91|nr:MULTISPECIES: copper ion binding protein [Bacillaceae]UTR07438.1 copper ion binding protein [Alkalihalobacillus sp. LMS6]